MAIFPKIQGACPYKGDMAAIMDGDTCRLCNRQVTDLTAMSDQDRLAFMSNCAEAVCVSYKFPIRKAVAAAFTIAALGTPLSAAAQDFDEDTIIVGAISDPAHVQYVSDGRDDAVPEISVLYDDQDQTADAAQVAPAHAASANQTPDNPPSASGPDLSQTVKSH